MSYIINFVPRKLDLSRKKKSDAWPHLIVREDFIYVKDRRLMTKPLFALRCPDIARERQGN